MWYVVIEGIKLPTPYLTYDDAKRAMDEIRATMGPCCMDLTHD